MQKRLTKPQIINQLGGFIRPGFLNLCRTVKTIPASNVSHACMNLCELNGVNVENWKLSDVLSKSLMRKKLKLFVKIQSIIYKLTNFLHWPMLQWNSFIYKILSSDGKHPPANR